MLNLWMSIIGVSMALSSLPQIVKLYQRKSSNDISIWLWIILVHGQMWWIWYGILLNNTPLIITNIVGIVLYFWIIGLTIFYRNRTKCVKMWLKFVDFCAKIEP